MRMQQARNFCLLAFFVVWRFSRGRIPNLAWASIQIKIAWSIQSWFWTSPIFARSILFQERKMLPFQAKFSLENSFKTFKQTNLWFFAVYVSSVLTRWIMQVSARPVFHWAYGLQPYCMCRFIPGRLGPSGGHQKHFIQKEMFDPARPGGAQLGQSN